MVSDDSVYDSLDAVLASGGDPTQPTAIIDKNTGAAVAVVRQLGDGSISVQPASSSAVANAVQSVTGFLSSAEGFLTGISVQLKKIGNAVQGGAVGAQAGYNAPTDMKPYLYGAAAIGAALLLSRRR